jgi:hypothetical protein
VCDSAVQCAASLLKAMEEKLHIWSLDEESLGLHMFATDYVICVDFGEASRHSFVYHFPVNSGNSTFFSSGVSLSDLNRPPSIASGSMSTRSMGKPIRQVVAHAPPLERLRGLVPFLREQRFACTVTTSVLTAGQALSIPCILVDMVALPKAIIGDGPSTREWEVVGLMELEGGEAVESSRLNLESRAVESSISLMAQCHYDAAWSILRQAEDTLGKDCEALTRLLQVAESQRLLPAELRQPYRTSLNWDRCWVLLDQSDVPAAPPAHEVFATVPRSPPASSAPQVVGSADHDEDASNREQSRASVVMPA